MFFECLILLLAVYFLLPRRRERIPRKSLKGLVRFVVEKFKDKKNCESENLAENLAENSPYCCDSCIKLIRRFDRFCTIFQLGNFAIP
ncbi:Protein CBG20314, partial [Caenorhabditis briggsae]